MLLTFRCICDYPRTPVYVPLALDETKDVFIGKNETLALIFMMNYFLLMQFDKIYHQATLKQQHAIINQTFKHGLTFTGSGFRTFSINPALSHNLLKMNEKGLLFIEQPNEYSDKISSCAEEEIRTPKPLRALPPQSSASTSFATSAGGLQK